MSPLAFCLFKHKYGTVTLPLHRDEGTSPGAPLILKVQKEQLLVHSSGQRQHLHRPLLWPVNWHPEKHTGYTIPVKVVQISCLQLVKAFFAADPHFPLLWGQCLCLMGKADSTKDYNSILSLNASPNRSFLSTKFQTFACYSFSNVRICFFFSVLYHGKLNILGLGMLVRQSEQFQYVRLHYGKLC